MFLRFLHHAFAHNEQKMATEILYVMCYSNANSRANLSIPNIVSSYPNLAIDNISEARKNLASVLKNLMEYKIYAQLDSQTQTAIRNQIADYLAQHCNKFANRSLRTYNGNQHAIMVEQGIAFNHTQTKDQKFVLTSIVLPKDLFENERILETVLAPKLSQVNIMQRDLLHEQKVEKQRGCCGP